MLDYLRLLKSLGYYQRFQKNAREVVRRFPVLENVPLWIAALVTGLFSVVFARFFAFGEFISHWLHGHDLLIVAGPICFFLSWFVVYRYAPGAKGSGIPQVMAAIAIVDSKEADRVQRSVALEDLVGVKTAWIKILSSGLCVIGGGAIGREGPTIQIAAGLFFLMHSWLRGIFPLLNAEAWLIAGGGAGIAAAFNTPLGGLVYAVEELATKHFNQFRTTLISAVMVAGIAALGLAGNYLYFGSPKLGAITVTDHFLAILIGGAAGAAGGLFGASLFAIAKYRKRLLSFRSQAAAALLCGATIAGIAYLIHADAIGPGHELVMGYLSDEIKPTLQLALARFTAPIISYAAGGAGGIFAPSLAAGASIGASIAHYFDPSQTEFFVLLGMVGFLTGVTHAPFTSMVLILEMTDRHSAIFPLMLATLAAFGAAKLIGRHSFYDLMKEEYLHTFRAHILPAGVSR
jgi:H+/Cl- antiporter ClcA